MRRLGLSTAILCALGCGAAPSSAVPKISDVQEGPADGVLKFAAEVAAEVVPTIDLGDSTIGNSDAEDADAATLQDIGSTTDLDGQPLNRGCQSDDDCIATACHIATCVLATGQCVAPAAPDGTACASPVPCSKASCQSGNCTPASTSPCDDGNSCTTDTCIFGTCVSTAIINCCNAVANYCDDYKPCTTDTCESGTCTHVAKDPCCAIDADCEDGLACTANSCVNGKCVSIAVPQPGQAACCDPTLPLPSIADQCEDNNPCTTDTCDGGLCVHTKGDPTCCVKSAECPPDGSKCTVEKCVTLNDGTPGHCGFDFVAGCACTTVADCGVIVCETPQCAMGHCSWTPIAGCAAP